MGSPIKYESNLSKTSNLAQHRMSYSFKEGKDEVHFITEEDLNDYNKRAEDEDAAAQVRNEGGERC